MKFFYLFLILAIVPFAQAKIVCDSSDTGLEILDMMDLGNNDSEANHSAYGFDAGKTHGFYAGRDLFDGVDDEGCLNKKDLRVVVGSDECENISNTSATFTMSVPEGKQATTLQLRALNRATNRDSFNVYIDGALVYNFTDEKKGLPIWQTHDIALDNLEGSFVVKIVPTESALIQCKLVGQLAFSWARLAGAQKSEVPEFSTIAALVALCGAAIGVFAFRKGL